jgi:glucose-6-phosphate isomerase
MRRSLACLHPEFALPSGEENKVNNHEYPLSDLPITVQLDFETGVFRPSPHLVQRRISDLAMMFHDKETVEREIADGDKVVYEILYHPFITSVSDMGLGVTRIFPGTVGDEYHMTKGHFHEAGDQPEIYFCVRGEGHLLMQTAAGDFLAEEWRPGTITHIPPMWAHRVVNTGSEMLFFVASYHLSAGHEYAPIEARGFAKRVVERDGGPLLVDDERWTAD